MLSIDGLELGLGELELSCELAVEPGECLAIAGPSGAGKTTLLRCVAGLQRPDRGRIACDGETWFDPAAGIDVPPEARRCAFVFQDYALFGHLNARRNVGYALQRQGTRAERDARVDEVMDRLRIAGLAERRVGSLSGGERQRVALARALMMEPRALLLDEPLAALDATTRWAAVVQLATVITSAGVPVLLVVHDIAQARALAGRVAVIERGRVVQTGTPAELAARPASRFVAVFTSER